MTMKTGEKMLRKGQRIRKKRNALDIGICFEPLEPRLLLSGSWGAAIDSPSPDSDANTQGDFAQDTVAFYFAFRRWPSSRMWPTQRAPVMPKGWPMEIEPPFTLYFSGSIPRVSRL